MADRVIFVCTIVLAAVYFYATSQIPSLQIGDPLGPKAFPYLLGIGLCITAGLMLIEILRAPKAEAVTAATGQKEDFRHLVVIVAVTIWTAIYFSVFEQVGYAIDTAVFQLGLMTYFNRGRWVMNTLTAVLFSLGSYLLFVHVLGVTLPRGVLPF